MNISRTDLVGRILAIISCALVISIYAYTAPLGRMEALVSNPAGTDYNLLVQGFRDGHLSLKKEVPSGFMRLADPYDPGANLVYRGPPYGLSDLSYYKERLYIYFGVTPALILFWPFAALTGHYLSERLAVAIFCSIGILVSLGLLHGLWRRYFNAVSVWVVALCALALAWATGVPALLPSSTVYQIAISCGYMLTMLALAAVWCALHDTERRYRWLTSASVAYGLAVGARPSLLLGAIILLVPVACAWRERRPIGAALAAAIVPITVIGLGLMLYNFLRFDSPFEFGLHYQVSAEPSNVIQAFNPRFLWFNFRVNFLDPAHWKAQLPFVYESPMPPLPRGYTRGQETFGVLFNIPLVWLALAAPLAWRGRPDQERRVLDWFVMATFLLFAMCALTLCLYWSESFRYAVDFLPSLVLLAVIGILGLERALATPGTWLAAQPTRRYFARGGWIALVVFSVIFNLLVSAKEYAYANCALGRVLTLEGHLTEAVSAFKDALRIEPDYAEGHHDLGNALWKASQKQEAILEYEEALQSNPDYADAHITLGMALVDQGRPNDAIQHYEEALRIYSKWPSRMLVSGSAAAHVDIGNALLAQGRTQDAVPHYEEALRLNPDSAEAHMGFGNALLTQGKPQDAIPHYEQALQLNPDFAKAHYNFGVALAQTGRIPEAMEQWEQTVRIDPSNALAHYNLGKALESLGRVPEAIEQNEQALMLRPDFAPASDALTRLRATQTPK